MAGAGRISATSGGFLLTESGTAHSINADFTRSQKTDSKVTFLDEATGAPRWTAQWEGRSAESPVLLGDRVYLYTRERNVGTASLGLDAEGKEVQHFNLPFEWNVSAGVLTHGRELFFHGLSSFGPFIVAFDPATGRQTWRVKPSASEAPCPTSVVLSRCCTTPSMMGLTPWWTSPRIRCSRRVQPGVGRSRDGRGERCGLFLG
ncbi:PQQ-binding-like beta-propeller repeat protein [Pseudoxanthomonas sp. NC8]|nr:PQQ-binding-like beta-propeller repeat protein [Pseudoxanthomonas sp. NC8]